MALVALDHMNRNVPRFYSFIGNDVLIMQEEALDSMKEVHDLGRNILAVVRLPVLELERLSIRKETHYPSPVFLLKVLHRIIYFKRNILRPDFPRETHFSRILIEILNLVLVQILPRTQELHCVLEADVSLVNACGYDDDGLQVLARGL